MLNSLSMCQCLKLTKKISNLIKIPITFYTSHSGASALHLSIAYKNEALIELLLRKGASVNQRAKGNFFLPIDQQDGKLYTTTTDFTGKLFLTVVVIKKAIIAGECVYV